MRNVPWLLGWVVVYVSCCSSSVIDGMNLTRLPTQRNCFVSNSDLTSSMVFCLPSVIISGFPKCGSSYLFYILSQHEKIVPTARKELCFGRPPTMSFTSLPTYLPATSKHILSGCLLPRANINLYALFPEANHPKILLVVRDVADMLWSAYNYWCFEESEECSPGYLTSPEAHRSPEHFHALVTSHARMGRGVSFNTDGSCYRPHIEMLQYHFGKDNILVLSSEAFYNSTRRLAAAKTILSHLDIQQTSQRSQRWLSRLASSNVKINAGANIASRGSHTITSNNQEGLYEISEYRPMMMATRLFIKEQWHLECEWLHETFDIEYDC